ncbi:MAG TPA: hypothetical protein VNI84_13620 [Pyrinomonadaceae bacterium]|nr:hypothetical protein [Pyrinomonadaceae bacterium]
MWLFTIHAIPGEKSPDFKETGGAYINCWIDFTLQDGAELLARFYIEQNNWIVIEIDEVSRVEDADYLIGEPKREYFVEAKEDGASFLYCQYPIEDKEDWENDETSFPIKTNH